MNERFIRAVQDSGKSLYQIAKDANVPYTTLSKLSNQKSDINNCAAFAVWKIAAAIGTDVPNILNPHIFLENTTGIYDGIPYKWTYEDGDAVLNFTYKEKIHTIKTGEKLWYQERRKIYDGYAEMLIDIYREEEALDETMKMAEERMYV